MQEFRRPEWSAHLIETQKTLTSLSEHDLLLLATVLTTEELVGFAVLGKGHDEWKIFQDEKSLHKPLNLQRGVKWPDPTKVKAVTAPPLAPPIQPKPAMAQAPAPAPVKTLAPQAERTEVDRPVSKGSGPVEILVQSNESVSWKEKVTGIKWPILTFGKKIEIEFEFLSVRVTLQGQSFNLVLGRRREDGILDARQAMIMPTPEAILFNKSLSALKKAQALIAGQTKS